MLHNVFLKKGSDYIEGLPLRELKFARARLGILDAFLQAMVEKPYENILVRDLCQKAEISEPSFYNYFPRKDDLFLYFISLWSIDMQLRTAGVPEGTSAIRAIFEETAKNITANGVSLMKELIAYQARVNTADRVDQIRPLTTAEKILVFGNVSGLENLPDQGLGPILKKNIAAAFQKGELSGDPEATGLILGSLFFGLPVLLLHNQPEALAGAFKRTLDTIFYKSINNR